MEYSLISGIERTLIAPPTNKSASHKANYRDFHIKFHGARVSY
jgi:hypothetical protein